MKHDEMNMLIESIQTQGIQDLAVFVQEFEPVFLYLMDQKSSKEQKQEIARLNQVVRNSKKRIEEIDRIITRLYEDNISGKISDERYVKMATGYESEQKELSEQTSADEKKLVEMKQKTNDLRLLLQTLRKCTDITELNRELVNRLIQRIEVHNNDKYDGHCHVKVDIYFTGVGIIDIPTEQEILKLMEDIRNSKTNEQSA